MVKLTSIAVEDRAENLAAVLDALYGAAIENADIAIFFRLLGAWLKADYVIWDPPRLQLGRSEGTTDWLGVTPAVAKRRPLKSSETAHICEAKIERECGSGLGTLVAARTWDRPKFAAADEKRLAMIADHVSRAFSLKLAMRQASSVERSLFLAFERLESAIVLLAAEGRVVYSNTAFDDLRKRSDQFAVIEGYIVFSDDDDRSRFLEAMGAIRPHGSTAAASIEKNSELSMGKVRIIPLIDIATDIAQLAPQGPLALMLFSPGARVPAPSPEAFVAAFALTAGESQVAAMLCDGYSPQEVAREKGTSLSTVRSQIKAIYRKLGVRSHIEFLTASFASPLRHIRLPKKPSAASKREYQSKSS